MPIYEPKDYEDVIARIQKKVIENVIFSCHKHIVCF